jgi:membrane protein YdbS with pleckstrin-like domain
VARSDPRAERPRRGVLGRYLLDGERIVTAVHQHWAKVAEPIASVVAGLVLVLALDSYLPASLGPLANLLWWAWFVLVARAAWKVFEWRRNWFVATDKRLILTHGVISQKVAMMSLTKVIDMSYHRSPLGRLLGYGTFVRESASQNQSLRSVEWVADPDRTYRAICAEIFGVDDHDRVLHEDAGDHRFDGDPTHGPDTTDHSTAIRIRTPGSYPVTSDPREFDIHEADTGPISY